MTVKNRKFLLIGANVLLIAGIVVSCVYMFMPVDTGSGGTQAKKKRKAISAPKVEPRRKPTQNYNAICSRPLRSALEPPKPEPSTEIAAVPMAAPSSMNLKLLGTVVESDHTYGLFRGSDGKEKLVRAGKKIDSVEVVSVDHKTATLNYGGKLIKLEVIKPAVPVVPPPPGVARPSTTRRNLPARTPRRSRVSRRRSPR